MSEPKTVVPIQIDTLQFGATVLHVPLDVPVLANQREGLLLVEEVADELDSVQVDGWHKEERIL